ncbi:MAG: aromatic amino acid ammonia-lyase [Chloroflexota bacterium]
MPASYSPLTDLSIADVIAIARDGGQVALLGSTNDNPDQDSRAAERLARIQHSAAWVQAAMHDVEAAAAEGRDPTAYYGINTGFGDNAGRATFRRVEEAEALSRKLLLSHTIGVGESLPEAVVRAALLIRVVSLAQGYSGVRVEVINTLIAMLNQRVYPLVPSQGSLGASGDLAPLAHLVIPISAPLPGEDATIPGATGYCYLNGQRVSGAEAMAAAHIPQIRLGAKEGVALINGTAISTAIAALALYDAYELVAASQIALTMTIEAMRGFRDAFLPYLNRLRSDSQAHAAATILDYLQGSTLVRGDIAHDLSVNDGPPQDPYSIRCAPTVFGAVLATLHHIDSTISAELHAVTDNPLVFASDDPTDPDYLPRHTKVISGGNFHGAPIGYVMDFLSIALTDLGSIAERRIFLLTDPKLNRGLPPFLIAEPAEQIGLNSGLMIAQYTAASLVSENKTLAHPASVDSIPSSANREDHVSMSTIAARQAAQIVVNTRRVVALELLCAAQALSLRLEQQPDLTPGWGARCALDFIRSLEIAPGRLLDVIREDTPLPPYVEALTAAIPALVADLASGNKNA